MRADPATSTVTLADRRFPACCAVCPPYGDDPSSPRSRLLGGVARRSQQYFVPCENGVLVTVEEHDGAGGHYELGLLARTCTLNDRDPDGPLWLPHFVGLLGGALVSGVARSTWYWSGAEPDWTCELVDRVAGLAFAEPDGPRVELVSVARAHELLTAGAEA